MQIRAAQHLPAFVDIAREDPATVANLDELLRVPWIQRWARDTRFHRWAISDDWLMAELNGGDEWWVVAYITSDEPLALPKWERRPARL